MPSYVILFKLIVIVLYIANKFNLLLKVICFFNCDNSERLETLKYISLYSHLSTDWAKLLPTF